MSLAAPVCFPRPLAALAAALVALAPAVLEAQNANPRFGRWLLKSDAPAPASNEHLIAKRYTSAKRVTLSGMSFGATVPGMVMAQRPDLLGAVLL